MAGGESSGPGLKRRLPPSAVRLVGATLAIVALVAAVALLAGVRSEFNPWGLVSIEQTDGGPVVGFLFALISALGSGIGWMAIVGAAIAAMLRDGRRYDAAFLGIAVFGALVLSRGLKAYFLAPRPVSPDWVATSLAATDVVVVVAVCVAIGIGAISRWRVWVAAGLAVALGAVVFETLVGWLIPITAGFDSFPSGHAIASMTFAAAAVALAWDSPRARYPVLDAAVLYVFAVGISRVYLHAHLPADVAAGWCVAVAWVIGFRLVWVAVAPHRA